MSGLTLEKQGKDNVKKSFHARGFVYSAVRLHDSR